LCGWRLTSGAGLVALAVAGCGGGAPQTSGEPRGDFPVRIAEASFPASQRLAQRSVLRIAVRNAGSRAIPDVAVTLVNPKSRTAAQALGTLISTGGRGQPILANRSRPVWVIDQAPGQCGSSCRQLGPGAAATASPDTWALGRLKPGATARFEWHVTAVKPGTYTVAYAVGADLPGGRTRAVGPDGRPVTGRFRVRIASQPLVPRVTSSGQVVYSG
jgi:hypothetical protein